MGRTLITKIILLIQKEFNVRIQHIYREANMCVDVLGKDERLHLMTMCIFEECPSFLNQFLDSDLYGNPIPHLISL